MLWFSTYVWFLQYGPWERISNVDSGGRALFQMGVYHHPLSLSLPSRYLHQLPTFRKKIGGGQSEEPDKKEKERDAVIGKREKKR